MTVGTSNEHPTTTACPSSYAGNHKGQNEAGETAAEIRDSCTTQQHQQPTSPMNTEIEAAVTFLADVIKASKFDESATETFRQVLIALLAAHYEGHWYPNDPFKGSGYRCLRVNGVMNPLLTKAAQLSGLPIKKFRHAFPVELTVWVDPGDVSVRFGEEGSIGVYYAKAGQGLRHDHQHMEDFKRLVAAAPKRSLTPPCSISSASVSSSLSSSSSSSSRGYENLAAAAATAGSPLSACSSLSSRNSPSNLVGSPPSTSYIFSPYDGKSMHVNARQAVINGYSAAAAAAATHEHMRQQSPSRKFQLPPPPQQSNGQFYHQQPQRNIFGRHTPPEAYNLFHQQQQHGAVGSYGLNAQQQQQTTAHFYGDLSKNDVQMLHQLEMVDFDAMRRTPPLQAISQDAFGQPTSSAYRRLYESPEPSATTAGWSSNYHHQQPPSQVNNADLQFCANTHFGSSWGPLGAPASGAGAAQRQSPPPAAAHRFGRVAPRTDPINIVH